MIRLVRTLVLVVLLLLLFSCNGKGLSYDAGTEEYNKALQEVKRELQAREDL